MTLNDVYRFVMASGLCFSLVACGGGDEENGEESDEAGEGGDGDSSDDEPTDDDDPDEPTDDETEPGETMCGVGVCDAGQHCNNGICINGCLTAENCSENQSCEDIDSDTKIGTCVDDEDEPTPVAKDCGTFCDKSLACQDPDWVMCDQVCTGLSSACVACVNDSNCGAGCEEVCDF